LFLFHYIKAKPLKSNIVIATETSTIYGCDKYLYPCFATGSKANHRKSFIWLKNCRSSL